MKSKKRVVLYFTADGKLTDEQFAELQSIPGARHRNAEFIGPDDKLEDCTGVAGPAVPPSYAHLPHFEGTVDADEEDGEEEEAADFESMSVAQLKTALDEAGVEYPATAKKAALVALAEQHLGGE